MEDKQNNGNLSCFIATLGRFMEALKKTCPCIEQT